MSRNAASLFRTPAGQLPILPPATIQRLMLDPAEIVFEQWPEGRIPGPMADQAPIVAAFVEAGMRRLLA